MSSSLMLNRSLKRTRGCSQPGSVHTRVQMGAFASCSPQPMALADPAGPGQGGVWRALRWLPATPSAST
jgi:hypothetical protein